MPDDVLRIDDRLWVPSAELTWRFSASGGPGGQHANTSNTRATVVFDITNSPSLDDAQRARLVARFGVELVVSVSDERSQLRNKDIALIRLGDRLREALAPVVDRRKTRPTKGSQTRRLDAKSARSALKSNRRRPGTDD